jgi:hypothetical protein
VRHNGGSVSFDQLGVPWPKHGCFINRVDQSHVDSVTVSTKKWKGSRVGVVVSARPGRELGISRIRVEDVSGEQRWFRFRSKRDWRELVGELVVYSLEEGKVAISVESRVGDATDLSVSSPTDDRQRRFSTSDEALMTLCQEAYKGMFYPGVRTGWNVSVIWQGMLTYSESGLDFDLAGRRFRSESRGIDDPGSDVDMGVAMISPNGDCELVLSSGQKREFAIRER